LSQIVAPPTDKRFQALGKGFSEQVGARPLSLPAQLKAETGDEWSTKKKAKQ